MMTRGSCAGVLSWRTHWCLEQNQPRSARRRAQGSRAGANSGKRAVDLGVQLLPIFLKPVGEQVVHVTRRPLLLAVSLGCRPIPVIDIDELVHEEILLAVPDHILCQDDCKGICPGCGADRNAVNCGCASAEVDPRWAGLKELVNRENG